MEVEAERHGEPILRIGSDEPPGSGVPPRQHPKQEAFFVLEGEPEFAVGDSVNGTDFVYKSANPGDMINIPLADELDGFRNAAQV